MENNKFIFIGGLHRSGTSMIFECLRNHPLISGFLNTGVPHDEGKFLQSVYPLLGNIGDFSFNQENHLTENSPLVSDKNRANLFDDWSKYWKIEKPLLLEKSPENLIKTRFLQEIFPNSYFIIVTRHPIAVSYATQNMIRSRLIRIWRKHRPGSLSYPIRWILRTKIDSLINHWIVAHTIFNHDKPSLNKHLLVKYEDFVNNPSLLLKKIFCFLEVEYFDIHIDEIANYQGIKIDINQKYFKKWLSMKNNYYLNFYHRDLIRKFESKVNNFGYSLQNL